MNATLRTQRTINSQYQSYSYGNRYFSKEYIPRLLWLLLDYKLIQVLKHIYFLYAFVMDIEEG